MAEQASRPCSHFDEYVVDGLRCCLSCGDIIHISQPRGVDRQQDDSADPVKAHEDNIPIYQYQDIPSDKPSTVRLILLSPGEGHEALRCEIVQCDLDQNPSYEAVSYTWATEEGDDRKSSHIHCGDATIPITINCEAALRQLRWQRHVRLLWIDSICINQSDVNERNHQVGIMYKVYTKAKKVQICINDPSRDYWDCIAWLLYGEEATVIARAVEQFRELFRRRYFYRVWVIQEVVLASATVLSVNDCPSVDLTIPLCEALQSFCCENRIYTPPLFQWTTVQKKTLDLATALRESQNALSSDPRDKIFSVLGLLRPEIRVLITVDYSLDLETIYGAAVLGCIAERGDLMVLYHIRPLYDSHMPASEIESANVHVSTKSSPLDEHQSSLSLSTKPTEPSKTSKGQNPTFSGTLQALSSFRIASLYDFLASRPEPPRENYNLWSITQGRWRAAITVTHAASRGVILYDDKLSLVSVSANPLYSRPESQILPHLRVHAHFIDISHGAIFVESFYLEHLANWCWENQENTHRFWSPTIKQLDEWIAPLLLASPEATKSDTLRSNPAPESTSSSAPYSAKRRTSYMAPGGYWNLRALIRQAQSVGGGFRSLSAFRTRFSLGYSKHLNIPGDAVYAIDGFPEPMLLRQVGSNTFRLVGECYIAKTELLRNWQMASSDCDEENGSSRTERQSRYIEIY
ncbi:hypothetical protein ACN47E_008451 [Coniothyrium glycines]